MSIGIVLGGLLSALFAVAGFLGFASPILDLFNHLQFLLFFATLGTLALTPWITGDGRWRRFVVAFVATGFVASSMAVVPEVVASLLPRAPRPDDGRPVLRLMTHNLFGINYDMQRVRDVIFAENPDIVALQEYFIEQSEPLHPLLVAKYPYFVSCAGGKRANIALYSKIPFTQAADGACASDVASGERTSHIIGTFRLPDQTTFTVVTTHLDWPLPVQRQAQEFEALSAATASIGGPVLLVGDFNSTSWSYALRGFVWANGFTRQDHNLITFPMRWYYLDDWRDFIPFLALDHVLTRGDVAVHSLHSGDITGSDHLPVTFDFSVTPISKQLDCCRPN